MKSIVIIIDYFGKWPQWFPLFIESCRQNPTVNWLFHTDCPFESYTSVKNVTFKHISKDEYVEKINKKLRINARLENNYKLCDVRPMYGVLYEDEISEFDFYGYGDIDVIYGDIRKFYTDKVLENYVISTHTWCISGHLALFRNLKWMRNAFRKYNGWQAVLENPVSLRFDEDLFPGVFRYPDINPKFFPLYDFVNPSGKKYRRKLYFKEQYTTPLTPSPWKFGYSRHPEVWYWKDGRLTNEINGEEEFIYLHFMNFISGRWINPLYKKDPLWKELDEIVFVTPEELQEKGMRIDRRGFHVMN